MSSGPGDIESTESARNRALVKLAGLATLMIPLGVFSVYHSVKIESKPVMLGYMFGGFFAGLWIERILHLNSK